MYNQGHQGNCGFQGQDLCKTYRKKKKNCVHTSLCSYPWTLMYTASECDCAAVTRRYSQRALLHTAFLFKQTSWQEAASYISSSFPEGQTHNLWIRNTDSRTCSLAHTSACRRGERTGVLILKLLSTNWLIIQKTHAADTEHMEDGPRNSRDPVAGAD